MLSKNNEVQALLQLMDDPDEDVYLSVSERLIDYGKEIIPALESLVEGHPETLVQTRSQALIRRVYFSDLQNDFSDWASDKQPDLLKGAVLIARYEYPNLNQEALMNHFDQIRRNVWLELNSHLTPMEQVNVINTIFYSFYKFKGHELTERKAAHFCINYLLDTRQGNGYALGIFYLSICELLDLPVFAMDIPRQFVFGYVHDSLGMLTSMGDYFHRIHFYIDPVNGNIFSQADIDQYLKKINATDRFSYMLPLLNKRVIYKMLEELALCYKYNSEHQKAEEIAQLMKIIENKGLDTML